MSKNLSKIITGVAVLGCLGVFVPSQVFGVDDVCGFYDKKNNKKKCEQDDRCEWRILTKGYCYGKEEICERDIIHHDEATCNLQKKHECKWHPEFARCFKKGTMKSKKS